MKLRTRDELAGMSDARLLAYLSRMAAEVASVKGRQEALWEARIAVYQEGRSRVPPITNGRLAAAAGVSEVAIITKLRQLGDRATDEGSGVPGGG